MADQKVIRKVKLTLPNEGRSFEDSDIEDQIDVWAEKIRLRAGPSLVNSILGREIQRLGAAGTLLNMVDANSGFGNSGLADARKAEANDLLETLHREAYDPEEAGGIHPELVSRATESDLWRPADFGVSPIGNPNLLPGWNPALGPMEWLP
jgi:hypothetical protein